jgi:NADH-quinone oxidoreductase subunit J
VTVLFYIAAVVAVLSTLMVVTRTNLVHALIYLVVSLFAVAVVFYTLGAPFVAALEVIVYAGAIMMLFLFAVMLLNVRADSPVRVPGWAWVGPGILVAVLLAELIYGLTRVSQPLAGGQVGPGAVSDALYGPYVLGVELASMLLLAALIGARHVAARARDEAEEREAHERLRGRTADELLQDERGEAAEEAEA